jgi:hypothetical protein
LSAGYSHTCGIRADTGEAQCWGKNDFHEKAPQGQLKTAVHFVCRSRHFLFFAVMLSSSLCSCGTG